MHDPEESRSKGGETRADERLFVQIEKVAAFCGLQLTKVPRVKDIEHEVDEAADS